MDGADAGAGEHRDHRLRHHRHVDDDPVALADALPEACSFGDSGQKREMRPRVFINWRDAHEAAYLQIQVLAAELDESAGGIGFDACFLRL
jgi:hypothetical protein